MVSLDEVKQMVQDAIPHSQVRVQDLTGGGDHLEIIVVSPSFEGKSAVDRQRMVYAALGDKMKGEIHAAKMETLTPAELAKELS